MKRALLTLFLLWGTSAQAWTFSTDQVCRLTHISKEVEVRLTYDPAVPIYRMTLTRTDGFWPQARIFALLFDGAKPSTITTDQHQLDAAKQSLRVSNRGFGNVLDGLQFNTSATGIVAGTSLTFSLQNAFAPVAAFRACSAAAAV